MKKEIGERNTLGPIRVGAVEIARTGLARVTETDTVGTAETSAENMAKTGATGVAREVAVGISVSTATLGSLKVSAIRGMDTQDKERPQQKGVTQIHMYKEQIYIYIYIYKRGGNLKR